MTTSTLVTEFVSVITDAAKGRSKLATMCRDIAAPAYNDLDKQNELAVFLTSVQRETAVKRDAYIKYLSSNQRAAEVDAFKKSVINSVTYAVTCAGTAAGCKFTFNQKTKAYDVKDLPVKGEGAGPTANGKDDKSAEQSAALVSAAEAAPVLAIADKQAHLQGVVSNLLTAGYTLTEIEAAVHAVAMIQGKREADTAQQNAPQEAKAPALLEKKLTATMAAKGALIKAPRKSQKPKAA